MAFPLTGCIGAVESVAPRAPRRRVAVILQPSYLPWLGYFAQLQRSDVFLVYDTVQFDKHGWRNRNRIKTAQGPQWLTVPVLTHGQNQPSNREVAIDNKQPWRKKHLASLRQNYARAAYFEEYMPHFEDLYARDWHSLFDLNLASFQTIQRLLGLDRAVRCASEFVVDGDATERLIALCRAVGADHFYEGAAGANYLDDARFRAAGLTIEYQHYEHPVYPQLHGDFVPYLSVVDLLFNCGPRSLEILAS
jgi:hypothetical protein